MTSTISTGVTKTEGVILPFLWSGRSYHFKFFKGWRRSGVFIVNFEHISQLVLVFLLLTLNKEMPTGAALVHECIWSTFKCKCFYDSLKYVYNKKHDTV